MPSDFFAGVDTLSEMVGRGVYQGKIVVDQVYAAPQERGFWVTGPLAGHTNQPRHGGQHHYLRDSLVGQADETWQSVADRTFDPDGIHTAMVDSVEAVSAEVGFRAQVEFTNLRRSGHPSVTHNGMVVYDRPPAVNRLSRAELDALHHDDGDGKHR